MKIDIYQSTTNSEKFLTVPAGTDVTTLTLEDSDYKSVIPFRQGRDIAAGESRIAFDSDAAIASISTLGYYLHSFEATFNQKNEPSEIIQMLAMWVRGEKVSPEVLYRLQQFAFIFPDDKGVLRLTPPGKQTLEENGLA
jgi:hypothetical protein